jgi:hypothetical protein
MNDTSLDAAFRTWWQDSYGRPPGSHAVMTHVAFGRHLLQLLELLQPAAAPTPSTPAPTPPCP